MEFYLDAFADFIEQTGVVIGITRIGVEDQADLADFQTRLIDRGQIFPVFPIDGRNSDDVAVLVHALLAILES